MKHFKGSPLGEPLNDYGILEGRSLWAKIEVKISEDRGVPKTFNRRPLGEPKAA